MSVSCQKQKWHPLFDHLVGFGKQGLRHREPEHLRSLQIDDQFELGRQLHRQVGRRCPAQDPIVLPNGRKLVTLRRSDLRDQTIKEKSGYRRMATGDRGADAGRGIGWADDVCAHRPHGALNRYVERVFDPSRKDRHWGRRKLARDQ